jgi:hypothetical protein
LFLIILPGNRDATTVGQGTPTQMEDKMNEKDFDQEFNIMEYIITSILTDTRTIFVEFKD